MAVSILEIIEACGKHGVKSFKSSNFEISFFGKELEKAVEPHPERVAHSPDPSKYVFPGEDEGPGLVDDITDEDDALLDEDDEVNLMIADPERYEELLHRGEIKEEGENETTE